MKYDFKKVNVFLAAYALVTMMMFLSSYNTVKRVVKTTDDPIVVSTSYYEDVEFSEENLSKYIKELNIRFPDIVLAQAKLESGNFKSKIFKENNNLFGMKCATRRPYTHKGENRGHAKYDRWQDCVLDYALFQAAYLSKMKTKREYFKYLSENYAQNPDYVTLLKDIIRDSE